MSYIVTINGQDRAGSADEIKAAFEAGKCRIMYKRIDGGSMAAGLIIDGVDVDTRGKCHSMWEEGWTVEPSTYRQALSAAYTPFAAVEPR